MKTDNKLIGTGLLTAIAASLCCITPVLALIAGTSGLVSTFSWLEPFRPYFIGLTILVLGFAWYQKLKPQEQIDCNCKTEEKPKFIQKKTFLGIVTVFAIIMLAFPFYSNVIQDAIEPIRPDMEATFAYLAEEARRDAAAAAALEADDEASDDAAGSPADAGVDPS